MTVVTPLASVRDESTLVEALRAGQPGAAAAFYDEHARHVLRTLRSILGADEEVPDLLQEVFLRGFSGIGQLREAEHARGWLTKIAIWVAGHQRRLRARRNRLRILSPEYTRPAHCEQPSLDARRSVYQFYDLLGELPAKERMAFTLRYVEGMTLPAAAEACGTSLATFKRRLASAQRRFVKRASRRPGIQDWVAPGARWTARREGTS
jgi:RNA polymerase sigma-70 factor (ECF subfamily)